MIVHLVRVIGHGLRTVHKVGTMNRPEIRFFCTRPDQWSQCLLSQRLARGLLANRRCIAHAPFTGQTASFGTAWQACFESCRTCQIFDRECLPTNGVLFDAHLCNATFTGSYGIQCPVLVRFLTPGRVFDTRSGDNCRAIPLFSHRATDRLLTSGGCTALFPVNTRHVLPNVLEELPGLTSAVLEEWNRSCHGKHRRRR